MVTPPLMLLPRPGTTVPLPPGPHGLLALLDRAQATDGDLCLEVMTPTGPGRIILHRGAVRQVLFGQRGGLSALVALDILSTGPVRGMAVEAELPADQFGLLPSIILDHARRTSAVVQGLAVIPAPVLTEDAALGTPIPREDTSTDDLLTRAKVTMTVRGNTEPEIGGEDFPEEFFHDLAADAATATVHLASEPVVTAWQPPAIGQMLGKCYLSAEIGRGASAIVYRALQMSLKVDVALKVFIPEDARRPHLSIREARVLARLNHPNILRVLDCSEDPPWPHLVMEYVDGSSLADLINQTGGLSPATAVDFVLQAARGLAHAHAEGVTHCDVKPGNLLINRRQEVKVADLGVARLALGQEAEELVDSRTVIGTPAYIAPELVRDGISTAGAASDLYSLGATLYHALCGEPPFLHEDPLELMVLQVRARHQPLRERLPGLDREVDGLVDGLLAKDPEARPTYEEVIAILSRLDQRLKSKSKPGSGKIIYATIHAALRSTLDGLLSRTTRRFTTRG